MPHQGWVFSIAWRRCLHPVADVQSIRAGTSWLGHELCAYCILYLHFSAVK